MSDAVPSYGFTAARRGYAPEQVDHALTALTAQRDEAWQRLSVLGAHIRELEARLGDARQAAVDAPEPDFGALSEQAAGLLAIAENEAQAVRDKAERFAEDTRDTVYEAGQARAKAATEYAAATRGEAEQAARRTEERTRAEAEKLRGEADRDARALRDAATGEAAQIRVAAAEAGERAEAKLAELRREADQRFAAEEAAAAAEDAKFSMAAERRLREAEQHRENVLGLIKQTDTDAQAKADQLIDAARREAGRIDAESAQERADFDKRLETVQTHLDHIKGTLASLTGKAVGMIEPGFDEAAVPASGGAAATGAAASVASAAGEFPSGPGVPVAVKADVADVADVAGEPASEVDTGEPAVPAVPQDVRPDDAPTTVLRLPAELRDAARPSDGHPDAAPVDPRAAMFKPTRSAPPTALVTGPVATPAATPADSVPGAPPVPPRPATSPSAVPQDARPKEAPARVAPEAETAVIPKIVIIDDGTELDSLPNTVGRRRT